LENILAQVDFALFPETRRSP